MRSRGDRTPRVAANGAMPASILMSPAPPQALNGTLSSSSSTVSSGPSGSGIMASLNKANEQTWLVIGRQHSFTLRAMLTMNVTGQVSEQMGDLDRAQGAYEHALRHNSLSIPALTQVASIARIREHYPKVDMPLPPLSQPFPH